MTTQPLLDPSSTPAAVSDSDRIGRYTRAELESMANKRGRKPPEYFTLFPERVRTGDAPAKAPRVRASLITTGDHTDPLIARLSLANAKTRALVSHLLDVVGVPQVVASLNVTIEPTTNNEPTSGHESTNVSAAVVSDPVYANTEEDAQLTAHG